MITICVSTSAIHIKYGRINCCKSFETVMLLSRTSGKIIVTPDVAIELGEASHPMGLDVQNSWEVLLEIDLIWGLIDIERGSVFHPPTDNSNTQPNHIKVLTW